MEENRNNRSVEKRLKDCLKNDRARIQVGRISHFGLLEMSRQRIRASVLESTMKPCPHCGGTGHVRSNSSVSLHVVRAIEEFLLKDSRSHITVKTPTATTLYVLNHKRGTLVELERRFGVTVTIEADETLGAQHYAIFRGAIAEKPVGHPDPLTTLPAYPEPEDEIEVDVEEEERAEAPVERPARAEPVDANGPAADHNRDRKRRRRRRRRGGRDREPGTPHEDGTPREAGDTAEHAGADDHEPETVEDEGPDDGADVTDAGTPAEAAASEADRKKRRRGKRGGKRNRPQEAGSEAVAGDTGAEIEGGAEVYSAEPVTAEAEEVAAIETETPVAEPEAAAKAKPQRAPRRTKKVIAAEQAAEAEAAASAAAGDAAEPVSDAANDDTPLAAEPATAAAAEPEPAGSVEELRPSRRKPGNDDATPVKPVVVSTSGPVDESKPKKAGWWQRKGFF